MNEGLLIALEGIDGSGHSTQSRLLRENLERDYTFSKENGPIAIRTKEPTDGPIGGEIKEYLSGRLEVDPETLALMFAADRRDHYETELKDLIKAGKIIILDRYIMSSLAYQGVQLDDVDWISSINSKAPYPDLTILLDVSISEAINRMKNDRANMEIFETEEKLSEVRRMYLEIAGELKEQGEDVLVIDGELPREEVSYMIRKRVYQMIEGDKSQSIKNINKNLLDYK